MELCGPDARAPTCCTRSEEATLKAATESRRKGGQAAREMKQLRALEMELCEPDAIRPHMLYSLGGGGKFYYKWWTLSSEQQRQWWEEILNTAADSREAGGAAAGGSAAAATHLPAATAAGSLVKQAKSDELLDLLLEHVERTNPAFNYQAWIEEVKAAVESKCRGNAPISAYRINQYGFTAGRSGAQ